MTTGGVPPTLRETPAKEIPTMSYRDDLLELIMKKSFKRGDFTLASGAKSNYYINGKMTALDSRGAYLTCPTPSAA